MKKSELRQIIREELAHLNEVTDGEYFAIVRLSDSGEHRDQLQSKFQSLVKRVDSKLLPQKLSTSRRGTWDQTKNDYEQMYEVFVYGFGTAEASAVSKMKKMFTALKPIGVTKVSVVTRHGPNTDKLVTTIK